MSQLVPDPSAVADFVVRMTRLPWPSGAADRDRYFAELGLVDAGPAGAPRNDPDTQWRRLTTPLSGVVDVVLEIMCPAGMEGFLEEIGGLNEEVSPARRFPRSGIGTD